MAHPYELWNTRRLLTVARHVVETPSYWTPMFPNVVTFDTEFIDFEKLPANNRRLAPFVRPAGTGKPIWSDKSVAYRFKPAYMKVKEVVDPFRPMSKAAGIDRSILDDTDLTPQARRNLLKSAMSVAAITSIRRRWEWLACKAIVDGAVTIEGEEYPKTDVNFRRASDHTVVLTSNNRWGDPGVSIFDSIQMMCDRMFNAEFGGFPTRLTVTPKVWAVMRKDTELKEHMDTNYREPRATIERGLIDAGRIVKVAELSVGGNSGAVIEVVLYRDTYENDAGSEVPFMVDGTAVMTSTPERIGGFQCFGAIIDPNANYQALEIYARNWMETGDPAAEYMLFQSAPLMVPTNPNATLKITPVAL